MKILIVSTSDIYGGAAKAAYRLHKALQNEKIDSQMLVQQKTSDDFTIKVQAGKIQKGLKLLRPTLDSIPVMCYKSRSKTLFSPSYLPFGGVAEKINEMQPDIVHLHWINGGLLKIEDLNKIDAPIIWSLHDMWAFTGGCHYDEGCGRYKENCEYCKVLGSNKKNDLSKKVFTRKKSIYSEIENITIVALSCWLEKCVKQSKLFSKKKIINLPNLINTTKFKPSRTEESRDLWGLPKNKKLILFGAMGATSDPRKGFKELELALKEIEGENIELVVFGSGRPKKAPCFKFKVHYLGQLHDEVSLITLYSAVDVMLVPSIQENLSNAIMEALSCKLPVVAFNIGGNSDMVQHLRSGYLAKPYDSKDLSIGIEFVLNHGNYDELCNNARDYVVTKFDSALVSKLYIELYKKIIKKSNLLEGNLNL